jgi:hypothetical protein
MGSAANNPQKGDLVRWTRDIPGDTPWIVLDFFPWGCEGKHAWAIQNPMTGDRRVVFKNDIKRVTE